MGHLKSRSNIPLDRPKARSDSRPFTCQNKLSNKQVVFWKNNVGNIQVLTEFISHEHWGGEWREGLREWVSDEVPGPRLLPDATLYASEMQASESGYSWTAKYEWTAVTEMFKVLSRQKQLCPEVNVLLKIKND